MKMPSARLTTVYLLLALASSSEAAYLVAGPIKGTVCRGFIIEHCSSYQIDAVRGSDGKLYTVRSEFEDVDDFNERTGRCSIRTKSKSLGLISLGINLATQPVFLTKDDNGEFKELDVEYITFGCVRK
jgi:hypothetical protein